MPSWQFGDWLDPDAPPDRPWEAKCDSDFIANAFFSWSARLLADAAGVIGEPAASDAFGALADRIAALTWERWARRHRPHPDRLRDRPELRIAPDEDRDAVGAALADLVDAARGTSGHGFPRHTARAAGTGQRRAGSTARTRCSCGPKSPSWLYQVAQGATTVWERWDAIRPDGSIHPGTMAPMNGEGEDGHMLSFNHYAYGAVIDWVYRHVAGLAPDRARPGYAHVSSRHARPAESTTHPRQSTRHSGRCRSPGDRDADQLIADVELPTGTTGTFTAPATSSLEP